LPRPSSANVSSRKSAAWTQDGGALDPSIATDRKAFVAVLHRSSSVGFINKSILDDERIMKAIRIKELKAQEKEDQLKQKIIAREQTVIFKQQLASHQELQ